MLGTWRPCCDDCSVHLSVCSIGARVRNPRWWLSARLTVLCWLSAVVCCVSAAFAITPKDVARLVSQDKTNQQFTDDIYIGRDFDNLEIPILVGSSVMPALPLVESPIYDEHPPQCDPWDPLSYEEFARIEKLGIGPCRQLTDSERSSWRNNVQMVLWPSGHVLWMVNEGKSQILRNKKGALVEYRFVKIDSDKVIKQIEDHIRSAKQPRGYFRKAILYDDLQVYAGAKIHDLIVVGREYILKSVSQVVEAHDDSYYKKWVFKFSVTRPQDEVKQFVDICDTVRNMLPAERGFDTLSAEPEYVWIGKTDLTEQPHESELRNKKGNKKVTATKFD